MKQEIRVSFECVNEETYVYHFSKEKWGILLQTLKTKDWNGLCLIGEDGTTGLNFAHVVYFRINE